MLLDVVAGAGLDRGRAEARLAGDEGLEDVRAAEERARRLGVQGVPFFVIGGQFALSGAQEPQAFLAAFDRLEPQAPSAGGDGVCRITGS